MYSIFGLSPFYITFDSLLNFSQRFVLNWDFNDDFYHHIDEILIFSIYCFACLIFSIIFNDFRSNDANPLQIPAHGSMAELWSMERAPVVHQYLRWLLHALWCVSTPTRRKVCNDPRCIQLRPVARHMGGCNVENCSVDYCKLSKRTKSHWDKCHHKNCLICREMYKAFKQRFSPDVTMNPRPNPDLPMSKSQRRDIIKKM